MWHSGKKKTQEQQILEGTGPALWQHRGKFPMGQCGGVLEPRGPVLSLGTGLKCAADACTAAWLMT